MAQARKAGSAAWAWTWIHFDHLGRSTVIADNDGKVVRQLAYKAFGEEVANSGTGEKPPYTYTGKERDSSGLMYYGARYYDPALARFITPDTVSDAGTQGLNRYAYALNNPLRYTDPTGHESYESRVHVERTNTLLDLQVQLGGTTGMRLSALGQDDLSAVLASLGVNGLRPVAVDALDAMRTALGLSSPEQGMDSLTADDIGGLLTREAERAAAHPVLHQMTEQGTQNGTGEEVFAGSVVSALVAQSQPSIQAAKSINRTSGLFRKSQNSGAFSELPEPMQLRHVKRIANQAGVGLKGVKVRIICDPEIVGSKFLGRAWDNGRGFDLYPDAFSNRETLVRTLSHERTHVFQYRLYGREGVWENPSMMENAAYGIENTFWNYYNR